MGLDDWLAEQISARNWRRIRLARREALAVLVPGPGAHDNVARWLETHPRHTAVLLCVRRQKGGLKSRHDGTGGNPPRLAEDCEADRSVCPRCGWPKRPDRVGHKHTGHLCFHCGYSTDRDDPATAGG
jgi:hypothetical protein